MAPPVNMRPDTLRPTGRGNAVHRPGRLVLAVLLGAASLALALGVAPAVPGGAKQHLLTLLAMALAAFAGGLLARETAPRNAPATEPGRSEAEGQISRDLARGVAHDVNNMLTVLVLDAEMLDDPQLSKEALQSLSRSMQDGCRQGAELTNLLLAYAGRQTHDPQLVDLTAALSQMQDRLRQSLMPNQRLTLRLPEQGVPVVIDLPALEMALSQLVTNAAIASEDNGEVRLLLDPPDPDGVLQITIADNGTGMGSEVVAQALRPYFTGRATGSYRGLGLSAADGFARQCGGSIMIASAPAPAPTQGTRVTLRLPANLDQAARTGLTPAAARSPPAGMPSRTPSNISSGRPSRLPPGLSSSLSSGGQARILVVDDNESVRDSLARRLRAGGHEVMVAGDITAARARLRLGVDALVTDVVLGGAEDGVALALEARGQDQFLALVFISGVMSSRQPELLQGDDIASFLRKPVNMSELSAVLDGLLAMRALGRGR